MKLKLWAGTSARPVRVFIQDTTKTDGSGLTGLASNSAGLSCYYIREGQAAATQVTLSAGTPGTWSSGGFVAVDTTNLPGVYEIGLPDAALASGARGVIFMLKGAASMAPVLMEIELDALNYQDGAALGLSRLDVAVSSRSTYAGGAVASVTAPVVASSVTGSVGSVTNPVTVGTNQDKTGYTASTVQDKTGYTAAASNLPADYLSAAEQTLLARLDATVSSRSTYAGADTPGTATLLGRIGQALTFTGANVNSAAQNLPTDYQQRGVAVTLPTGEDSTIAADVQAGLTAQGYTPARAGYLDSLSGIVASIWSYAMRTLSAFGFSVAASNLPTDYAKSNAAPSWYAAPDNADVQAALADLVALLGRTDPATAVSALNALVTQVKAKTDNLPAHPADRADVQIIIGEPG